MEQPYKKFEEVYDITDYEISTPQGWKDISRIMKTIPYEVWYIELSNDESLKGADTHILYTENHEQIFLKDIKIGQLIETDLGYFPCTKIQKLDCLPENMYDIEVNSEEHEYYSNGFVSHNTTTSGIFMLWFAFFNKDKTIAILAHKADMSKAILSEIKYAYENMPDFLKPGITEYNAFNIKFDNNSEMIAKATSPNALRGNTVHLLFLDEMSHVADSIATEFFNSNYPTLSASKGSCIIVSTPNGTSNLYYRLWKDAIDKKNTFVPNRVDWWEVPGRDETWKEETIKNLGSIIRFNQEFGNLFLGSTITLIDANFITEKLKWETPIEHPDEFTKIWKRPVTDHKYLVSIDTAGGVGSDSSTMNIFDITDCPNGVMEQVAIYKNNTIPPPQFAELVYETCQYWNNAYIIGELNGLSAEVINRLFNDLEYENIYYDYEDQSFGMYADKVSKPKAAIFFKDELENDRMLLRDTDTIDEIGYFEEVSTGVYKAKVGRNNHDDCVMTCLWAAYFIKSPYFLDERDTWGMESEVINENDDYKENPEAEEALNVFLEADKIEHGDNWLENDEMNRYNNS